MKILYFLKLSKSNFLFLKWTKNFLFTVKSKESLKMTLMNWLNRLHGNGLSLENSQGPYELVKSTP